jgi:hypothetical protein
VCFARNPDCAHCLLAPECPSAELFLAPPKKAPAKKAPAKKAPAKQPAAKKPAAKQRGKA